MSESGCLIPARGIGDPWLLCPENSLSASGGGAESSFARFVPLPECQSALAAARELTAAVLAGATATPLFLHGPPGVGKSHLMAACAEDVARWRRDARLVIVSARDWDLTESDHDLLIVEDLQYLPARAAVSLSNVWDERLASGLATIATATLPPRRLAVSAHLSNRLAGGLVVALESLTAASRRRLLTVLADRQELRLADDVIACLAERLTGNARTLEGALAQLQQLVRQGRHLDHQVVDELWQASQPTLERIIRRVSAHFSVAERTLSTPSRRRAAVLPRQLSMYLARRLTGLSLEAIGQGFGGRDHTTVLHACRKIEKTLAEDVALAGAVRQLSADLA